MRTILDRYSNSRVTIELANIGLHLHVSTEDRLNMSAISAEARTCFESYGDGSAMLSFHYVTKLDLMIK